jgi:2-polyprenyl-3-methyl-5-hydroxy-6-metoxy-1,4-benzoquinol methylase
VTNNTKQHTYWESDLGHREYDHPVVKAFAQQRIDYISQWLDLEGINTALDVGCGNGFSTDAMRQHIPHIWGVDYASHMLKRHPFHDQSRLILANAFHLPFASNAFDLVYGWEVLHHIDNPGQVVREMNRVSRQYVLLAEPNRQNPAQLINALADTEHRWVLRYNLTYLCQLLEAANLQVIHASCGGWLFPNITPTWLLAVIMRLPYKFPLGISIWVLGVKKGECYGKKLTS